MLKIFLTAEALCEFHKCKKVIASSKQDSMEFIFELNIDLGRLTYVEPVEIGGGNVDPYKVSIQRMSERQRSMH